jgi:hypothetical protein
VVARFPVSWRRPVLAVGLFGAVWSVALTARSSGRAGVTPFRRLAEKPWARRPITVAAAW